MVLIIVLSKILRKRCIKVIKMKINYVKLIILIFIGSLLVFQTPARAEDSFLYSVRAQKTPSAHSLTDYTDAESVTFNSNLLIKELYIKNSESYLYIGLRVEVNASFKGVALVFDVDHDQKYADDVKILYANQNKSDGYFYQNSALSLQSNSFFDGAIYQVSYIDGKTYDLYEFSIPFTPNSNPTTDMFITDPSDYMLGFDIVEILNDSLFSWNRGSLGTENTIQKLDSQASSFYTLVLAGPGKFAVPDFNPVVTTASQSTSSSSAQTQAGKVTNLDVSTAIKGTPGFEFYLLIIALPVIISLRKIHSRRSK